MPNPTLQPGHDARCDSLTRLLVQCLVLGGLLVLALPAARGYSTSIGWLPLWLVLAPLASLAVLERNRWMFWRPLPQQGSAAPAARRRRPRVVQARRVHRPRNAGRQLLTRA